MLSWAAFVGLSAILLFFPLSGFVATRLQSLRARQVACSDARVGLISELINGIRVTKFYAWEACFRERIQARRGAGCPLPSAGGLRAPGRSAAPRRGRRSGGGGPPGHGRLQAIRDSEIQLLWKSKVTVRPVTVTCVTQLPTSHLVLGARGAEHGPLKHACVASQGAIFGLVLFTIPTLVGVAAIGSYSLAGNALSAPKARAPPRRMPPAPHICWSPAAAADARETLKP